MKDLVNKFKIDILSNILAAALWSFYLVHSIGSFLEEGEAIFLLLLLRNSLIVILFLIRREAKSVSKDPLHWVVTLASTLFAFAFSSEGTSLVSVFISHPLFIFGAMLACYAVLNLGRSFGLVPANRGIIKQGLYTIVRHPMYSAYLLMDVSIVLSAFSVQNLTLLIALIGLFSLRASFEEKWLSQDPQYEAYRENVKYRFIPGLI